MPLRDGQIDFQEMRQWSDADFRRLRDQNPEVFTELLALLAHGTLEDRQACALAHYRPMNPMAEPVHRSVARECAIVGGNRTPVAGTRILTGRGMIRAEDIKIGDEIILWPEHPPRSGRWRAKPRKIQSVTETYASERPVPIYRLTTKRGYRLMANAIHPVWVCGATERGWHNGQEPDRVSRFEELQDIRPGQYVALRWDGVFPTACEINPDDAYFLGLMTGDGSWCGQGYRRAVMSFTSHEQDDQLFTWLESYLDTHGVRTRRQPKASSHGVGLVWCNRRFRDLLVTWEIPLVKGPEKTVPECVWRGTKEVIAAFLRGLMDTDGCATTKPSAVLVGVSESLLRGAHLLLLRFGIVASLHGLPAQPQWRRPRPSWRLEITGRNLLRYREAIGFLLPRKQARLPVTPSSSQRTNWDRIIACERIGDQRVFGFTVEPNHQYFGDGFLNHNSGKTESALVELAIALTGHVPEALKPYYPMDKVRPPIRALVMCASLIDSLPMLHGKLRWDTWSGYGAPEDGRGHWGWIPKRCLAGGSWEKAYSEKYRTLTTAVDSFWIGADGTQWSVKTHSKCAFGSFEQDSMSVAGKSYHLVVNDEFPPADLYREEKMRTLDVKGRIITAFTPPDEAGTNRGDIAWFHDQVYERGLPGPQKDPLIDTVVLWTEKNRILAPEDVRQIIRGYTEDQLQARLFGSFLHLSGVVYPVFSSVPVRWCFTCRKKIAPLAQCPHCGGDDLEPFCHVVPPWDVPRTWPVVFVMDPHPRKPDACGWFAVSPSDDVVMIGELEAEGSADEVARSVFDWETAHRVHPARRLMDPNIATETNDRMEHGWTLRMAYDRAGLRCDLANDSIPLGIQNVNALLIADPLTRRPRFTTFSTNRKFIFGISHWAFDEWQRNAGDKEPKETVRDRHKDFPDLLRYLANSTPDYRSLVRGNLGPIRMATPTHGY